MNLIYEIRVAGKPICIGRAAAVPVEGECIALLIQGQPKLFMVKQRVWSHKDETDAPFADDLNHVVLECGWVE